MHNNMQANILTNILDHGCERYTQWLISAPWKGVGVGETPRPGAPDGSETHDDTCCKLTFGSGNPPPLGLA